MVPRVREGSFLAARGLHVRPLTYSRLCDLRSCGVKQLSLRISMKFNLFVYQTVFKQPFGGHKFFRIQSTMSPIRETSNLNKNDTRHGKSPTEKHSKKSHSTWTCAKPSNTQYDFTVAMRRAFIHWGVIRATAALHDASGNEAYVRHLLPL